MKVNSNCWLAFSFLFINGGLIYIRDASNKASVPEVNSPRDAVGGCKMAN